MTSSPLQLFSLDCGRTYGEKVASHIGVGLSDHEERDFEDSEYKVRPLVSVRGSDVFVIQSLHGDDDRSADEKLCRLLFLIGALKDAAARRVTAVVPYLCFARKDRKTKPRDPVTTRYIAALFEAVGTDCVVTLDVHNLAAFQNAFRCRTEHLEATRLFAHYVAARVDDSEVAVVSPDAGGVKRADRLRAEPGPGLPDLRLPAAAGRLGHAHRRGHSDGDEGAAGHAGRCAHGGLCRLRRRDPHQCTQLRGDLLPACHLLGARGARAQRQRHPLG